MNILFCCEGFLIDGVASYNLHMAAALRQAGHRVAILGRWAGRYGYQARHRDTGVEVLQYVSPTVVSGRALRLAREFAPDAVISDGRRAYPLALAIHNALGTPVVTNFMDDPVGKDKPGRRIEEIHDNSAAWVSPEPKLVAMARALDPGIPVRQVRRAVMPALFPTTPVPPRNPFRLLCLGRLSNHKFAGQLAVIRNADQLLRSIPTLEVTVVGGGWRQMVFAGTALRINAKHARRVVRIAGYQPDPSPWIRASGVVCGGSTCGLEAILSNRPIIAMSGFWFGLITPDNLEAAVKCYYAERDGHFYIKENPEIVLDEIVRLYEAWDEEKIAADTATLRETMLPQFSPELAAQDWEALLQEVL